MSEKLIEAGGGPRIGLALGGGGARGLAHILALEALDELGVKPVLISGASIGAIFGAAYAAGLSGRDIRQLSEELFASSTGLMKKIIANWPGSIGELWNPFSPGQVNVETLLEIIYPDDMPRQFEQLSIPFIAVATDFHQQHSRYFDSGPLIPAVAASSCLPAVMKTVRHQGHVLIDGGFTDPVPFEALKGRCDLSVAIDVNGEPRGDGESTPTSMEALLGMAQIVARAVMHEKLRHHRPDILLEPPVGRFRLLDFYKQSELFEVCAGFKDETKRALEAKLQAPAVPPGSADQ